MASVTIEVDEKIAKKFARASAKERRKIQLLLSLQIQNITRSKREALKALMDKIGAEAEARGMTPEILESILNER